MPQAIKVETAFCKAASEGEAAAGRASSMDKAAYFDRAKS